MKNLLHIILCVVLLFAFNLPAQTTNIDFEATPPGIYTTSNAVSGWTISSQTNTTGSCNTSTVLTPGSPEFSIITTPQLSVPNIGTLPNSPLGGTVVARLNNFIANGSMTKLAQTISVTPGSFVLMIAFAGVWEDGGHSCCEQSSFKFLIRNQFGNIQSCSSLTAAPTGSNCSASLPSFSVTNNTSWSNWQLKYFDLYPYLNTLVTLEIISNDCTHGDHYGTLFIDTECGPYLGVPFEGFPLISNPTTMINFCAGSNIASIYAPLGYASYLWTAPTAYPISLSQSTLSILTVSNAVVGSIYTLNLVMPGGTCTFTNTFALVNTTVNIAGIGSNATCLSGAYGTATVIASGSGAGYNYLWTNSSNATVGINSTASNLGPGIYTVHVTASGTQSSTCGNSSATVAISIAPSAVTQLLKPFCGNEAYLYYPNGTNYQWYNNLTPITSSLGGTASGYTVTSPLVGAIYRLGYNNQYGCHDSINITLISVSPGSVSVTSSIICPGASNGIALISLSPAPGSPPGANSYSVFSTGITPAYNASLNPTSFNFFQVSGLSGGGTYSVNAFDGSCKYSTSFSVTPYSVNFTLSPQSATLCPGNSVYASVMFSSSSQISQYTYSWSPSLFLWQTGNTSFNVITPTTTPGSVSTSIYTVVVTPTLINCPFTKTLSVTLANLLAPVISPVPALCDNANNYSISTNPIGGTFYNSANSAIGATSGVLTPSLAAVGVNTFTYAISVGSCIAQSTATFAVMSVDLTTSSNSSIVCGQTVTLSASGTNSYLWSNASTNSVITVSPLTSSIYTVKGTDTANMCSKTSTIHVNVTSTLVLSVTGNTLICTSKSATLTVSGANTYTWSNNLINSQLVVSPQSTSTYSVIGNDVYGCVSNTQVLVGVNPSPTVSVVGSTSICPGITTSLTAYGSTYYQWSNGAPTQIIIISPSVTTTYTVTGSNYYGCSDSKSVEVTVSGCEGLINFIFDRPETKIYPNPTSGNFSIETENKITLFLSDALGRKILEETFEKGNHLIDLSNYANGVYVLKANHNNKIKITKLVKKD